MRAWIVDALGVNVVAKHMVAISSNLAGFMGLFSLWKSTFLGHAHLTLKNPDRLFSAPSPATERGILPRAPPTASVPTTLRHETASTTHAVTMRCAKTPPTASRAKMIRSALTLVRDGCAVSPSNH